MEHERDSGSFRVETLRRRRRSRYVVMLPCLALVAGAAWAMSHTVGARWGDLSFVLVTLLPVALAGWAVGSLGAWSTAALAAASRGWLVFSMGSPEWEAALTALLTFWALGVAGELLSRLRQARDRERVLVSSRRALLCRLRDVETRDPETGVLHERSLRQKLSDEVLRATRYGHPLSVVRVGLANSPGANHRVSPKAMREAARVLECAARSTDVIGKSDDEELVVVLTETGYGDANTVAERIREMVRTHPDPVLSQAQIAVGVVSWPDPLTPSASLTGDGLLDISARALDVARNQGGDCVVSATL